MLNIIINRVASGTAHAYDTHIYTLQRVHET